MKSYKSRLKQLNWKKGTIHQRIMKANIILILIPMIALTIVSLVQLSFLTQTIGNDGAESIKNDIEDSLEAKSIDTAEFINNYYQQISLDVQRIGKYESDLFNEDLNITGSRSSYCQSGTPNPPDLISSSRYNKQISNSYSDYVNITNLNWHTRETINISAYMDYICDSVYKSRPECVSIKQAYENGISRVYPFIQNSRPINEDLRLEEWYWSAKSAYGNIYYGKGFQSIIGPAIQISKAVYYENSTLIGCVCVEIQLSSIRSDLDSIKIRDTGYISLVDKYGYAIAHPDVSSSEARMNLKDLETDSDEFNEILDKALDGKDGIDEYDKDDELWIVSYAPVEKGGYIILAFAPNDEITESGENLKISIANLYLLILMIFVIVVSIVIVVIIFGTLRVSRRITEPIIDLTRSVDAMAKGNLIKEIPIGSKRKGNEISILAQSFQALLITMRLGNESYYQGDIYLAYKNYSAALELFTTNQNIKGVGICWNNLGNIYRNWGEFEKAKDAYEKSIKIAKDQNNLAGLSSRQNNLGLLLLSVKEWKDAETNFTLALEIDEKLKDMNKISTRKRNLGILYLLKGDLKRSKEFLEEAFKIDNEIENKASLAEDHFQLGRFEYEMKNIDNAIQHFEVALKYAEDFGNNPLMRNVLTMLVKIYDDQNNTVLLHKTETKLSKINELLVRKKDVVFVIDQSGSMGEQNKMRAARKGAKQVFDSIINADDRVAIIGFHSEIKKILNLTFKRGNLETINNIFDDLQNTLFQTMFFDAVGVAIDLLKGSPKDSQKWIVALTDGLDNLSYRFTAEKLAKYIKEREYKLNIILIGVGYELRDVYREMDLIVDAALRGKYIPIYSEKNLSNEIEAAFKRVSEIMASSEIEGFAPEESGGEESGN